jgi:hypothetical protein
VTACRFWTAKPTPFWAVDALLVVSMVTPALRIVEAFNRVASSQNAVGNGAVGLVLQLIFIRLAR